MKKILGLLLLILLAVPVYASTVKKATLISLETGEKIVVNVGTWPETGLWKLFDEKEKILGYSVVTDYAPRLSSSITSVQTTIPVTSMTTKDGHTLVMADLGSKVFLTVEPGANKEEIVMCTGISSLSFTGCTRGLAFYGTSTTAVAANAYAHQSGSSVIMSNVQYVYNQFVNLEDAQTINGIKTFASTTIPRLDAYLAPTLNTEFAPKKYVDDTAIAGAPAATESTAGIGKIATREQAALGTSSDGTYRYLLPSSIATSTGGVATTSIPVTGADGKLDPLFLKTSGDYAFSGSNTFTGSNIFSGDTDLNATTTILNYDRISTNAIASTTITGTTTPLAIYFQADGTATTSNGSATSTARFDGFAVSSATAGQEVQVQTEGVVNGFTGLTPGETYYFSTGGAISTATTTYSFAVGRALSATRLLIEKQKRVSSGVFDAITGSATYTISSLNFKPTKITIFAGATNASTMTHIPFSMGDYTVLGGNSVVYGSYNSNGGSIDMGSIATNCLYIPLNNGATVQLIAGVISNVTETGFVLTTTETGTFPGSVYAKWTAEE